jgi:general transcription factor 3C polypeptide 3 (transcription factor C subunit 4)
VSRLLRGTHKTYTAGAEQKFYLRQIKAVDYCVLTPEERDKFYFAMGNRASMAAMKDRLFSGEGNEPLSSSKEHDADLFALYGHLMLVGGAATTALHYYFRAYVLRPEDPTLNLCMALAYLSWAWKRQAANRQYQIQQALSFLERYGQIRRASADEVNGEVKLQEAEFNEALTYASMGLVHLAVPKLKKCLDIGEVLRQRSSNAMQGTFSRTKGKARMSQTSEPVQRLPHEAEQENFGPEAAYALRNIMAMNGDLHSAHEVTKKWLVL